MTEASYNPYALFAEDVYTETHLNRLSADGEKIYVTDYNDIYYTLPEQQNSATEAIEKMLEKELKNGNIQKETVAYYKENGYPDAVSAKSSSPIAVRPVLTADTYYGFSIDAENESCGDVLYDRDGNILDRPYESILFSKLKALDIFTYVYDAETGKALEADDIYAEDWQENSFIIETYYNYDAHNTEHSRVENILPCSELQTDTDYPSELVIIRDGVTYITFSYFFIHQKIRTTDTEEPKGLRIRFTSRLKKALFGSHTVYSTENSASS